MSVNPKGIRLDLDGTLSFVDWPIRYPGSRAVYVHEDLTYLEASEESLKDMIVPIRTFDASEINFTGGARVVFYEEIET